MQRSCLTLAALGGPHTFNARAAKQLTRHYPQFGEIRYFPTSEAVLQAALCGEVDDMGADSARGSEDGNFHDQPTSRTGLSGPVDGNSKWTD